VQFIPEGTDLKPILPVLANVFDQALDGGGAKNINFQELAADLAEITFAYPFRIPPYASSTLDHSVIADDAVAQFFA
jgi:aarF domain-containing kinase